MTRIPINDPESPKYLAVVKHVRSEITSGRLRGGDRLPTVAELRLKMGASTAAVDRALFLLDQEGLIDRRHGRGIFVAHNERKLKKLLGYPSSSEAGQTDAYAMQLIRGVRQACRAHGFDLMLLDTDCSDCRSRVDGLIVHGGFGDSSIFDSEDFPIVSVMIPMRIVPSVVADDYQGVMAATRHLIDLGHRKIACFMGPADGAVVGVRILAYQTALREAGIEPDPKWISQMRLFEPTVVASAREPGHLNMEEWENADWRAHGCTALICRNDSYAAAVLRAARLSGMRVPGDLSVVGYDGTDERDPHLTSVRVPIARIAFLAGEMLLRKIHGEQVEPGILMLPTELVVGDTTAPPGATSARD